MIPPSNQSSPRNPKNAPGPPKERDRPPQILLVDCDAYYVQVAQMVDPDGAGKEQFLVVGGREDGRGVVTSVSYPARRYGIRSGMPVGQALRMCPQLVAVPVPMEQAVRKNAEIAVTLEKFTPLVEVASVDEFYVDLSGTELLYQGESLESLARRIQAAVREETGIQVSIGGGTQRTVAKMATSLAKPGGVFIVAPGEEAEFMKRWDLSDIPYIGPAFTAELLRRGLRRVEDALAIDEATLRAWLGEARGSWLYQRVRGIDYTPVMLNEARKSIGTERTFSKNLEETNEIESELLALVQEVGAMLRERNMRGRTISVSMRCADFSYYQIARTLREPIDSDRALFRVARKLLALLRERRWTAVRLVGISVGKLTPNSGSEQLLLFETPPPIETTRDRAIARARDKLRTQFGKDVVQSGRIILHEQKKASGRGEGAQGA